MPRTPRLALFVLLLCFATPPATALASLEPAWVATPPVGVVNQPVGLLFANTTAGGIYINSTIWEVRDSAGNLVAEFVFRFAAFWPVPPGGVIPGGFVPEYADTFTATAWWYTPSLVGPGVYDTHSKSIQIPVFGGAVVWNVAPDPVFERASTEYSQVTLNLTNGSPNTIWLKSTNPWEITDAAGAHVYSPWTSPAYTPVLPGATKSWPWALVHEDSSFVSPGGYIAHIDIYNSSGDTTGVELTDRFTVMPRPVGSVVWRVTPIVQSTKSVVLLTLTNATSDSVCCSSLIPWTIRDDAGSEVYSPLRLWAILTLAPGESRAWTWDERDNSGTWVDGGIYHAEVTWWKCADGSGGGATEDFAFLLVEPPEPPSLCEFLVPDSYVHLIDDPVPFVFTNCVPDSIVMPWYHGWWVTNAAGIPVHSPIVLMVHTPMQAFGQFTDSWNQRDSRGVLVPPGAYYLWSGFWDKYCATFYTVRSTGPLLLRATTIAAPGEPPAQPPPLRVLANPAAGALDLEVACTGSIEPVTLRILSITGRVVFEARYAPAPGGIRRIFWDGRGTNGAPVNSGIYFVRADIGALTATRKVVFLR